MCVCVCVFATLHITCSAPGAIVPTVACAEAPIAKVETFTMYPTLGWLSGLELLAVSNCMALFGKSACRC